MLTVFEFRPVGPGTINSTMGSHRPIEDMHTPQHARSKHRMQLANMRFDDDVLYLTAEVCFFLIRE